MSYTFVLIILIGLPILIYFIVSVNRKKKNLDKNEKKPGGEPYREGEAKDRNFR